MVRNFDWETFYLRKTVIIWTKMETLKLRYWDLALLFLKTLRSWVKISFTQSWPQIITAVRGPCHEQFFHRNSNSMENSFCSHPSYSGMITMIFCTWHDSDAVVACAKFRSDWSCTKTNFLSNLNYDGKIVREMVPWYGLCARSRFVASMTWLCNYSWLYMWDAITYPCLCSSQDITAMT